MIEARIYTSADGLTRRLSRKAASIAEAAIARRKLAAGNPARWRSARLLWPLFTKD